MKNQRITILVSVFVFIIFFLSMIGIYCCPIRYIFGLCCPTCGITRAVINVLQLNFSQAFYYHMFWPFFLIGFIIYILCEFEMIKISKKKILLIACIFSFMNIIYYFYRLFGNSNVIYFDFTQSLIYKIISMFK